MKLASCFVIVGAACCIFAAPLFSPTRPPFRMVAELTGPVSKERMLPLKLTFFSEDDALHQYKDVDFLFVLLDERGQQVGDPSVFITDAVVVPVELKGKVATYQPRLIIAPSRKDVIVGHRFQLISIMHSTGLASSSWFTLKG